MKVVVTGGGGFIGSQLVKYQLDKGREVVANGMVYSWVSVFYFYFGGEKA